MSTELLNNKKIVIDARFLATHHGGLARYSRELIKSLVGQKTGIKWVIITRDDEEFPEDIKIVIDKAKDTVDVIGSPIRHYTVSEQTEYLKLLNEINADLVHFTNFNHPVRYKKPFVVTVHDLTLGQFTSKDTSWLKRKLYNFVVRKASENARLVFTVSDYSKKAITKAYGIPSSRISVTYNGIDHNRFYPISNTRTLLRVARQYKIKKQYILYVGQWATHKNLRRLLEAFAKVNDEQEYRDKYSLVIVGRPRQYFEEIKEEIARLGLDKSVVLPGFVDDDDLPLLYNGARLFAFPSLMEGFGIPPLEAMACGVPVVSSNAASLPEVLEKAALYFDPENVSAIADALKKGLTDSKLREELAARGLKQAQKYSWASTAQLTMEGYSRAIKP